MLICQNISQKKKEQKKKNDVTSLKKKKKKKKRKKIKCNLNFSPIKLVINRRRQNIFITCRTYW